jgi:hypothetical protein
MMAFRLVIKKCHTAKATSKTPMAIGRYADNAAKPISAALEKPTMMSAEPEVIRALRQSGKDDLA